MSSFFRRGEKALPKSNDKTNGVAESSSGVAETEDLLRGTQHDDATMVATVIPKLKRYILPTTAIIVMLSYMDRGNLGFVAADVCTRLDLNHTRYGVGVALFGVGYVTSQVPSNYFLRRCGATVWFSLLLIVWGVVAASFSYIQERWQFYVLRLLLGVAEGGTFPGVWYYMSTFFPSDQLTYPYATIEAAIAIASPLSSPIAAGLLSLDGLFGFSGWRLLFFVEGVIPIMFGGVIYWLIPATPEKATFLTSDEKSWLREKHYDANAPHQQSMWKELHTVVQSKAFWVIVVNGIIRGALLTAAFYWTTLIIDDMLNGEDDDEDDDTCASSKSTDIKSVALTAVPFTICAAFSLWFGHATHHVRNRSRLAGLIIAVSGVFLYGWVIFRHISFVVALLSLSFAISCFLTPNALIVGLVGSYYDRETRATALGLFNGLTGVGMVVGPIWLGYIVDHQGYGLAVTILALAAVCGGLGLITVQDPLMSENPKLGSEESDIEQL